MKKTNEINSELSIEEKRKKLIEAIEKQSSLEKKKDILLMPFINEIKLMLDKKMSINSQLKALNGIGIKISYKTYKNFLDKLVREFDPLHETAAASGIQRRVGKSKRIKSRV